MHITSHYRALKIKKHLIAEVLKRKCFYKLFLLFELRNNTIGQIYHLF